MYNLNWYGKENAIRESFLPSNFRLIEDKESSKNWDTTENLYIEGDNLEVLKLLQKSYFGKVKMIYIDPPYNTGNDFVYKDDFRDNVKNYKERMKESYKTNTDSSGRYHTNWLNMMYPRLKLAKNLLTEDGVIFISLDDNEIGNLRKICDEVFGETNFIAQIVWEKVHTRKNSAINFSVSHEYVLCYAKKKRNSSKDDNGFVRNLLPRDNTNAYSNPDNDPKGLWKTDPITAHNYYSADYTITKPNGIVIKRPQDRYWAYSEETIKRMISENTIVWGEGDSIPLAKRYLCDVQDGLVPITLFSREFAGDTSLAKRNLDDIFFECKGIFDYTKPVKLIMQLLRIGTKPSDIILDYFSGSATTAHAVMQLNAEDGGNRKFIMVQIPEETDEKSEAYKNGYKTICEIGKERIRRVGKQIVEENKDKEGIEKLDIGFKVFKLKEVIDMFYKTLNNDAIKIEVIKKTKVKGSIKIKIDGETYYLTENENEYIIFNYSKGQKEVIASIFNKKDCKDTDYMELERLYTDKLVEFNQGWYHSDYVTTRILDEIYKQINN